MATVATIKSGVWSDTATWDGGVLPGAGDTAQILTGHTVTLDQNITINTLTNTGNGKLLVTGSTAYDMSITWISLSTVSSATALIHFDSSYSASGSTITAHGIAIGAHTGLSTAVILIDTSATGSVTITSNTAASDTSTAGSEPNIIRDLSSADVSITITTITLNNNQGVAFYIGGSGDKSFTTATTIQHGGALQITATGTNTLTLGGINMSTNSGFAIDISGGTNTINPYLANITIYGGGVTSRCISITSGSLTINNVNVVAPTGSGAVAIYSSTSGNLTINGDVRTSGSTTYTALNLSGAGNVVINGSLNASSQVSGGPLITTGAKVTITGNITSGTTSASTVSATQTAVVRIGASGQVTTISSPGSIVTYPVSGSSPLIVAGAEIVYRLYKYPRAITTTSPYVDDSMNEVLPDMTITNADSDLDPADVRDGVVYDSDNKTGTMHVPDPADVYKGVPVDDTVGTASITAADGAAILGSQIASLSN